MGQTPHHRNRICKTIFNWALWSIISILEKNGYFLSIPVWRELSYLCNLRLSNPSTMDVGYIFFDPFLCSVKGKMPTRPDTHTHPEAKAPIIIENLNSICGLDQSLQSIVSMFIYGFSFCFPTTFFFDAK